MRVRFVVGGGVLSVTVAQHGCCCCFGEEDSRLVARCFRFSFEDFAGALYGNSQRRRGGDERPAAAAAEIRRRTLLDEAASLMTRHTPTSCPIGNSRELFQLPPDRRGPPTRASKVARHQRGRPRCVTSRIEPEWPPVDSGRVKDAKVGRALQCGRCADCGINQHVVPELVAWCAAGCEREMDCPTHTHSHTSCFLTRTQIQRLIIVCAPFNAAARACVAANFAAENSKRQDPNIIRRSNFSNSSRSMTTMSIDRSPLARTARLACPTNCPRHRPREPHGSH